MVGGTVLVVEHEAPVRAYLEQQLADDGFEVLSTDRATAAFELVEHGLLTPAQFRAFSCDNAIRLHGGMNPHFFDGTRVEAYARALLTRPAVEAAPAYD